MLLYGVKHFGNIKKLHVSKNVLYKLLLYRIIHNCFQKLIGYSMNKKNEKDIIDENNIITKSDEVAENNTTKISNVKSNGVFGLLYEMILWCLTILFMITTTIINKIFSKQ